MMALGRRHSLITKFIWIFFLVNYESILVICDGFDDDSLKAALEAIERRQKDLEYQDNEFYGQPEDIGYGFQKTLGLFDNLGPAVELGSFDSNPKPDIELQNVDYGQVKLSPDDVVDFTKGKSNFRERISRDDLINQRIVDLPQGDMEYLQFLKNLWNKYRKSLPEDVNVEDLTDEQVEEILSSLLVLDKVENDYSEPMGYMPMGLTPVRNRRNYRVFDKFGDRRKRIPSFGEGIYGKRIQNINYQTPREDYFLYSLKYVNPEYNRDVLENLKDFGMDLSDDKDPDVMKSYEAINRPKYAEESEPFWLKNQDESEDAWLPGPVSFPSGDYDDLGRNEKRELKHFKNHNGGISLKGLPVKRSTVRVRKEAKGEMKVQPTVVPPKKVSTKKPTTVVKKQNATKPEVGKKVVRAVDKHTKEELLPVSGNAEIDKLFNPKVKKSIDWSQYFGIDKRTGGNWLKEDSVRKAESHIMPPKNKRMWPQYQVPFDTRSFTRRNDLSEKIDKVENKIGDIEDRIIDDAVKYTGAHSGTGKQDLTQVKDKVIQRLEAAYSLEKMRSALEEFKALIKPGRNVETVKKTSTEPPKAEARTTVPKESSSLEKPLPDNKSHPETTKRVAVKKESAVPETSDSLDFLSDVIYGGRQYDKDNCPVLEAILHNCLLVEEMGGKYAELLVPLCSLQQICYFCGPEIGFTKLSMCDAMYLTEAQSICQGDSDCQVSARNTMLALQDLYEQDVTSDPDGRLLSGSCLSNPCVQRYFLNAPGAIYPLGIFN